MNFADSSFLSRVLVSNTHVDRGRIDLKAGEGSSGPGTGVMARHASRRAGSHPNGQWQPEAWRRPRQTGRLRPQFRRPPCSQDGPTPLLPSVPAYPDVSSLMCQQTSTGIKSSNTHGCARRASFQTFLDWNGVAIYLLCFFSRNRHSFNLRPGGVHFAPCFSKITRKRREAA